MSNVIRAFGYDCNVVLERFAQDKSLCVTLIAANTEHNKEQEVFTGEAIAKPSVYIEGLEIGENQTVLKNYSETKDIVQILVNAGIVEETGQAIQVSEFSNDSLAYIVNVLMYPSKLNS